MDDQKLKEVFMETTPMKFKRTRTSSGDDSYHYQKEQIRYSGVFGKTLYDLATKAEIKGAFELDGLEPEKQLKLIIEEIQIRIKITKQEIFIIGELLCMAKRVCQQATIGFQDWIKGNFDFSYETAKNFMNVHKQCMGFREMAIHMPTSILYKISEPGFPEELREHLITNGNLEKMTNGHFKKLTQKYKEGGFEAIENDIEEINQNNTLCRQTSYTLDICENSYRVLEELRIKVGRRPKPDIELPEAGEINTNLILAIEEASTILWGAITKSNEALKQLKEDANNMLR
jgi:hypothetical protein